jgi:hypothetical protein
VTQTPDEQPTEATPHGEATPPSMWPTPEGGAPLSPIPQATSSNAIVALVLAIAAWPICPVIFAIIGLVFASKASKEIQGSDGRIGGEGYVTAARIVAWINIGFYAALLVLGLLFVIIFAIAGGMSGGVTGF